jgi:hypothetical protein
VTNKITGGKPGPGRPKGSRNKVTGAAKDIIAEAAERLGGVDRLVKWAKEDAQNERAYWSQIFPKLLPLQLTGDTNNPVAITQVTRQLVRPQP